MNKKPLILIAPGTARRGIEFSDYSINLSDAYPQAVVSAGGMPWVLPCIPSPELVREAVERADGLMLTGGDDVDPDLYDPTLPDGVRKTIKNIDKKRDQLEILLIKETLSQKKPILAICRGHQILNIALEGTLIADIPLQHQGALNHSRSDKKNDSVHDVQLIPGSLAAQIWGRELISVNSSHHQAIGRLAAGLKVTGRAPDGIVEVMEYEGRQGEEQTFLVSVQFHPERLVRKHPEVLKLFQAFINACQVKGSKKV